jgi:hypothetical protein
VLEGQGQMLLDLQRCAQPLGEQRDRRVVDDGGDLSLPGLARDDQPGDVGWSVVEGQVGRAIVDLLPGSHVSFESAREAIQTARRFLWTA